MNYITYHQEVFKLIQFRTLLIFLCHFPTGMDIFRSYDHHWNWFTWHAFRTTVPGEGSMLIHNDYLQVGIIVL